MPITTCCPKCQKRYQVPDTALGKRLQCKSCQTLFPVVAVGTAAAAVTSSAPGRTQTSRDVSSADWARFGIDGPLKKPAQIFPEQFSPTAKDILGNYAAEPGFAETDQPKVSAATKKNDPNAPLADIINNPFVKAPPKKKPREANADGKSKGSSKDKNKNKNKKDQQQGSSFPITIYSFIGGLFIMGMGGFLFFEFQQLESEGGEKRLPVIAIRAYELMGKWGVVGTFIGLGLLTWVEGFIRKAFASKKE